MANSFVQRNYATPAQWESRRELITELYEAHKLNKVIQIMEEQYDFVATVKMYKTHFARWGLQKNFRAKQVSELLHQKRARDDLGKATRMYIRGKEVNAEKLKTYLHRTSEQKRSQIHSAHSDGDMSLGAQMSTMSVVVCRTPSPMPLNERLGQSPDRNRTADEVERQNPRRTSKLMINHQIHHSTYMKASLSLLSAPDSFGRTERCMHSIRTYVEDSFTSGYWGDESGLEQGPAMGPWFNMFVDVVHLLDKGRSQRALRLIRIAFDQCDRFFAGHSFHLLPYILEIALYLRDYRDLAKSLINSTSEISRRVCGDSHPLSVLMGELRRTVYDEIVCHYRSLTDCFDDSIAGYIQQPNDLMCEARDVHMSAMLRQSKAGLVDFETAEAALLKDLAAVEKYAGNSSTITVDCKATLCYLYQFHNRYDKLSTLALEVLQHRKEPTMLWLLAETAIEKGDPDKAIALANESLSVAVKQWGPTDGVTFNSLGSLAWIMRESGQSTEADAVIEQWDHGIDVLCEQLENTQLNYENDEDEILSGSEESEVTQSQVDCDDQITRDDVFSNDAKLASTSILAQPMACAPWTPPLNDQMELSREGGFIEILPMELPLFEDLELGFFDM